MYIVFLLIYFNCIKIYHVYTWIIFSGFREGSQSHLRFLKLADAVLAFCLLRVTFTSISSKLSHSDLKISSRFKGGVFLCMFLHGRPLGCVSRDCSSPGTEASRTPFCPPGAWTVGSPVQASCGLCRAGFMGLSPGLGLGLCWLISNFHQIRS